MPPLETVFSFASFIAMFGWILLVVVPADPRAKMLTGIIIPLALTTGPVGELLIWNKPVEKTWVPVTGTINFSCGQDKPVERVMAPAEPSPIVLNITVASDDNCGLA